MHRRKGGISAPVLAILTFAVLLVVGVAILMYFYVIAPQATQQSQLSILGEPVIHVNADGDYILTVTIKNLGSDQVTLSSANIIVGGESYSTTTISPTTINAGQSTAVTITWSSPSFTLTANQLYTVILQTNYGNFEFSAVYRA